jgi:ribosomal protein S18 acetylase RimI-like enzyme
MRHDADIAPVSAAPDQIEALADILIDAVASGGSVSFMHPLPVERARRFWQASLAAAGRGESVVLGARVEGRLVGTVTLMLDGPENQPHRAEIAKLMTRRSHRGGGIARGLMLEAERIAVERGRTLLTLDTAAEGGAGGLYESLGYRMAGVIPDYALKPHGGLVGTVVYYKRINA